MKVWRADAVSGAVLAMLGAGVAVISLDYQWFRGGGRIGPGFVPGVAGLAMILLGVVITAQAVRVHRGKAHGETREPETVAGARTEVEPVAGQESAALAPGELPRDLRSTLTVLVIIVLAVYLTPRIGFLAAFWLLLASILLFVEGERIWRGLLIASATTFIAWLVFDYALAVPLPTGILG